VVVAPGVLFPNYTIEIDEQHVASLALGSADDVMVLAIVTLGCRPRPTCSAVGGEPPQPGGRPGGAVPVELPGGGAAHAPFRNLSAVDRARVFGHLQGTVAQGGERPATASVEVEAAWRLACWISR